MSKHNETAGSIASPSPSSYEFGNALDRRTTVIILERDGSLRQYPPDELSEETDKATVMLPAQAIHSPSMIDRIFDLTLDLLGLRTVELRIYEDAM